MSFHEEAEKNEMFRQKSNRDIGVMFNASKTHGANPLRLAQICASFDFTMCLLGWQDKPLAKFTEFLTNYQASIDAKYHNDAKDILIAEEIERRRAERKGLSIVQQQK